MCVPRTCEGEPGALSRRVRGEGWTDEPMTDEPDQAEAAGFWDALCDLQRYLALILQPSLAWSGADDERVAGGFDDFARDGPQLVDLEHAPDWGFDHKSAKSNAKR